MCFGSPRIRDPALAKTDIRRPSTTQTAKAKSPGKLDLSKWGPKRPEFVYELSGRAERDKAAAFIRAIDIAKATKTAFEEVANRYELDVPYRITLLRFLLKEYQVSDDPADSEVPLPDAAPELWSGREGRKENPIAFIQRVYAPWLGRGLNRAHIRNLDLPLYRALSVWVHRHPKQEMSELPSISQSIDDKIARLSLEFSPDELRKLGLAIQNRGRRK